LQGPTRDPVLLVADGGGVVARTVDGTRQTRLVVGAVEHPLYDAPRGVLWFVQAHHLYALDLGAARAAPVVVIPRMPALPFSPWGCDSCVWIDVPHARVAVEHRDYDDEPDDRHFADQIATSRVAAVDVSAPGHELLQRLRVRVSADTLRLAATVEVGPEIELPASARAGRRPDCWKRDECCAAGCGHVSPLPALRLELLVVGRHCQCGKLPGPPCEALCVLRDPISGQVASIVNPARWSADAEPAPCAVDLDESGVAYVADDLNGASYLCTREGCERLRGDVLGWLTPTPWPFLHVPEDENECPELGRHPDDSPESAP
jgi:hypothetical protein